MSLIENDNRNSVLISTPEKMNVLTRILRLSPLANKVEPPENTLDSSLNMSKDQNSCQTYYGVFIPCESKIGPDEEILHLYMDKNEALKVVKKYKKARFKAFKDQHDAVAFSLQGIEPSERNNQNNPDSPLGTENRSNSSQSNSNLIGGEKPSQFKGPKPQDMVLLRKTIENGDFEALKNTVWDNPRYLVSSGDTPSILQEGSRYNALHVAVKAQNVQICDYLLSTISDPQFIQLLYGDNIDSCKERASILLDLYLNTPDKAMNETPLHFAVKFGAKDIVDLLVSYPQCNRNRTNKFGEQPKDIICQRCKKDQKIANEIAFMLEERFYVPVLHSEDGSKQPVIGEPFSPGSPPSLNSDPISPRIEIRAFAGPMNKSEAHTFRKKWKTPPRLTNSIIKTPLAEARFRLQDVEKGLEKVGRNLAQQMNIGWKEYWPFLDTFTDLTSIEGLGLLEDYLKNKFTQQWNTSSNESFTESLQMTPKTPTEKVKDVRKLDDNSGNFSEKSPVKSTNALSPMGDLCVALKSLTLTDTSLKNSPNYSSRFHKLSDPIINQPIGEEDSIVNNFLNPGLNPYLCVEKSCQVFAKRLGLGFSHALTAENEFIVECLKSEMKHLQQTVTSYIDDPRFRSVNFHLVHSRVAQLVAQKLQFDNQFNDDYDSLRNELVEISISNAHNCDLLSSDEEDYNTASYRHVRKYEKIRKRSKNVTTQIKCLAYNIVKWMSGERLDTSMKTLKTEEDCMAIWYKLQTCNCPWQVDQFSRANRKNSSFKRHQIKNKDGIDILSSSPKSIIDTVSKKLFFEGDEPNENLHGTKLDILNAENDRNHNVSNERKAFSFNDDEIKTAHCVREIFKDVSDDDTKSDSDEDVFFTPIHSDASDYEDANDETTYPNIQAVYVFVQGDKPSKVDKSVYDAICNYDIDVTKYPYVYRWRHTIGLYPREERESWPAPHSSMSDDLDSPITCSFNIGYVPNCESSTPIQKRLRNIYTVSVDEDSNLSSPKKNGSVINPITLMTPTKNNSHLINDQPWLSPKPSMQVSKWMRVTGPNSPRSALINKNYGPNISLGF